MGGKAGDINSNRSDPRTCRSEIMKNWHQDSSRFIEYINWHPSYYIFFHISVYYLRESLGTVVLKRHQSCCLWTTTGCIPVGWRWAAKDFLRQMDQHELLLCKAREEQYGIREVGRYPSILTNTPGQPRSRSSPAIHFRCLASKKPGNPMKCPEILQKHHANSGSVNSCPLNREATSFTKNSESWASAAPSSVHGSNPFETLSSPSPEEQSSGLQTAAPGGSKFQTRTQEKFRNIFLYGLSISWGTQFYPYVYIRMYIHTYIYIYLFIHWLWGIISIRSRGGTHHQLRAPVPKCTARGRCGWWRYWNRGPCAGPEWSALRFSPEIRQVR